MASLDRNLSLKSTRRGGSPESIHLVEAWPDNTAGVPEANPNHGIIPIVLYHYIFRHSPQVVCSEFDRQQKVYYGLCVLDSLANAIES